MRNLWLVVLGLVAACGQGTPDATPGTPTPEIEAEPCDRPNINVRTFDAGEGGDRFGDLAGDFTVETLSGEPWTLSEQWTGCDSYVFVTYFPNAAGDALWAGDGDALIDASPPNSHIFFVSMEDRKPDRRTRVAAMRDALRLNDRQEARVHFVVDRLDKIEGSVGDMVSDYIRYQPDSGVDLGDRGIAPAPDLVFFGIDVEQRWDPGGNTNNVVGGTPTLEMAGYLPHFYNHKAELAFRLAQEEVNEVVLLDEVVTDRLFTVESTLPEDMSAFDTLEFDVQVICQERNPFGCSEWDRIARIEVCLDGTDCADTRELVRWITPYWRRGERRWAIDASPMLPLLQGGTNVFRVVMGPEWERATPRVARMALRLSTRGESRATGATLAFRGGNFDAKYNTRDPFTFTPPEQATKVELVMLLSGHGQDGLTNCSEWCDHRHHHTLNGTALPTVASELGIGTLPGCGEFAKEGVPPGQWGNWAPLRAYWCPGLPVAPIRLDVTNEVTLGATNTLTYSATLGSEGEPGGGNIDLSTFVVWYE